MSVSSYIKVGTQIEVKNRILGQIFGLKWNESGKWRRLHNVELHSFYHSPSIARVIKPRRLRWAVDVARMGEGKIAFKILRGLQSIM